MLSSLHVHVVICILSGFDMENFSADAQFLWQVVAGVSHCPIVTADQAAQFNAPVVMVQEPMIGFRDRRLHVSSLSVHR